MRNDYNQARDDSERPGQAEGGRAAGGGQGLDLSLGHFGTEPSGPAWQAVCDACHYSMHEATYQAAEAAAPAGNDPACPGCGRQAWIFFPLD